MGGAGRSLAERVANSTKDRFQIQYFPANEIVSDSQVLDATAAGTIECAHTMTSHYAGKDPTFGFGGAVPFGVDTASTFCRHTTAAGSS